MHIFFIVTLFFINLHGAESFITNDEYAKMLYNNPRGIGCDKCHGQRGEGMVISSYIKGDKRVSLIGPDIRNISIKEFKKALSKSKRLMPEYFLTDMEKAFLYYYITKKETNDKK